MDWNFPSFFWPYFGAFAVIALAILAFDVWMLVDAIQRPAQDFSTPDAKTWWIVGLIVGLVTGLPAIAIALAYFFIVRQPATRRPPTVESQGGPGGATAPSPPVPAPPPANCRNCGAKLVAGSRFCHSCGAPTT
jgi:hypothetical protein